MLPLLLPLESLLLPQSWLKLEVEQPEVSAGALPPELPSEPPLLPPELPPLLPPLDPPELPLSPELSPPGTVPEEPLLPPGIEAWVFFGLLADLEAVPEGEADDDDESCLPASMSRPVPSRVAKLVRLLPLTTVSLVARMLS